MVFISVSAIAHLFPGQGSQSVAMMAELYQEFDIVKKTFEQANDVLAFDLWQLIQNDAEKLNQTENTQVAMLCCGYAAHLLLKQISDFTVNCYAGHSLGEYTALVAANYLPFDEALLLVRQRGELMRDAVPNQSGAMAAILGKTDDEVIAFCQQAKGVVEAANFNAPGQVVIAGEKKAVLATIEIAKDNGVRKAVILPVSVPSHCALMKEAAIILQENISAANWQMGDTAVINNVDGEIASDLTSVKNKLVRQLYCPVLWTKSIEYIVGKRGITTMIECGPGKVLTALNKRINRDINTYALFDKETARQIRNVN